MIENEIKREQREVGKFKRHKKKNRGTRDLNWTMLEEREEEE